MSRLSEDQVHVYLGKLPDWRFEENAIGKTYVFRDFRAAVDFVNQVAEQAEKYNHHPDLTIRYNRVTARLTTHDEGGVTGKDFMLAEQIENISRHALNP